MTGGNADDYGLERGKARFPWRPGVKVLGRTQISTLRVFLAVLLIGLVTVAPAASAPSVPTTTGPADGTEVTFLPAFAWERAAGADHYEFQLAADTGFNSLVYSVSTKNTRATPDKTVPNGTYYWRVRSVDSAGARLRLEPVLDHREALGRRNRSSTRRRTGRSSPIPRIRSSSAGRPSAAQRSTASSSPRIPRSPRS